MSHPCQIGGKSVELAWTNSTARSLKFRASQLGVDPRQLCADLADNGRAEYSLGVLLWLVAPEDLHSRHRTPESLWLTVADDEVAGVVNSVVETLGDGAPSEEKKSTSKKSRSRGSS